LIYDFKFAASKFKINVLPSIVKSDHATFQQAIETPADPFGLMNLMNGIHAKENLSVVRRKETFILRL
jgi:hypothetical protein